MDYVLTYFCKTLKKMLHTYLRLKRSVNFTSGRMADVIISSDSSLFSYHIHDSDPQATCSFSLAIIQNLNPGLTFQLTTLSACQALSKSRAGNGNL